MPVAEYASNKRSSSDHRTRATALVSRSASMTLPGRCSKRTTWRLSGMPRMTSLMAGDCYKAEALPTKCMPAKEHCGEDSLRLLAIISHGSWTAAQKLQLAYHLE